MRQIIISILLGQLILCSCGQKTVDYPVPQGNEVKGSHIIEIVDSSSTPTVELLSYNLIVDAGKDRKSDADEVLAVKRKWPLAMQSKNPAEFDAILSKEFTFKGGDSFYNRNDYIKDRTSPGDWIITFVKYENVTLQFIGERGIMNYVNHVTNKNQKTGDIEIEHMTWVDIYVLEDGNWKIGAALPIDYRLEIPNK